jgi:N-acetylneuraminate synthase
MATLGASNPDPYLIAEIGCNHCGEMERARELVRTAATFCRVPCVKFQKRNPREVLSPDEYDGPHPNPMHAYGPTYGAHRERLELNMDQHRELFDLCSDLAVDYACSVWDPTSAREIAALGPRLIKIPSACNTWYEMAGWLCDHFGGEIHVSLGMTLAEEVESIVEFYAERGRAKDLILYHCTSGYPVPFEDCNLLEIPALVQTYGGAVKGIGFSGHHLGIAADIAALALGARYFERHFTLDRTLRGTDHAASLEPDGMRRLWRDLSNVHKTLRRKTQDILPIEQPQWSKLKWNRNAG